MIDYSKLPIKYPAKHDYGRRIGPTLAVAWHMAEGTNVASYLSTGNVIRGVSVHYTVEQQTSRFKDGEIVRCMPEGRISGSINPDTIRTDDDKNGYFGASHARAALGVWWGDPNQAVISVEVAGFNRDGPTDEQVRSMILLQADIERRYSGRVVPLGHRDFQNVKPCPGSTRAIKRAYTLMGGHGKDYGTFKEGLFVSTRGFEPGLLAVIREDSNAFDYPGGPKIGVLGGTRHLLGFSPGGRDCALVSSDLGGGLGRTVWVRAGRITDVKPDGAATTPEIEILVGQARQDALHDAQDAACEAIDVLLGE